MFMFFYVNAFYEHMLYFIVTHFTHECECVHYSLHSDCTFRQAVIVLYKYVT